MRLLYRWMDGTWKRTALPPVPVRPPDDQTNDIVVQAIGQLVGSTFYIGWENGPETRDTEPLLTGNPTE